MPADVIINPTTGEIYWNDNGGTTQSISIRGDSQNKIDITGYSSGFSPGSSGVGTFVIATFNDNAGTSAFTPGTSGFDLGSSVLRWNTFATNANLSGTLVVSDSTISSSIITGSVKFNGGIAISGNASIGQSLNLYGAGTAYTSFTGFKAGSVTSNTLYTLPLTYPSTGTSVLQSDTSGVMSWVAMASGSGSVNSGTATFAAFYASTSNAISENANLRFTGTGISVGGNINSSSTTTGSFYVFGGLGISGNAFIGGTINISSTTPSNIANLLVSNSTASTTTASGALVVTGGAGIGGSLNVAGASRFSSATVATSIGTGALTVTGGAGIAGSLYVGEASRFTSTTVSLGSGTGALTVTGGVGIGGSLYVANTSRFESTTISSSVGTGALTVSGGVGIGGSLFVGDSSRFTSSNISISSGTGALTVTGGVGIGGSLYVANTSRFESSTVSSSVGTGALVIAGGVGIGGSLFVGNSSRFSSTNVSSSSGTGALTVSGGVGIGGSLYVANASRFESNINSSTPGVGGFVASGGVGIGLSVSIGGRLQIFNGSLYTAFSGAQSGVNTTYTLPTTSPATGSSILSSTAAGILSWVPLTTPPNEIVVAAGSYGYVQYAGVSNAFAGSANFQYSPDEDELVLSNFPVATLTNQSANLKLLGTNVFSWSGSDYGTFLAIGAATGFTGDLIHAQVNGVSRLQLNADGYLRLGVAGTGFTLPITNGTSGQVLSANTNGIASWATVSSTPGGSNKQIQYNNSSAFGGASGFEYTTGGTAVTVSVFSPSGAGYTSGMWIHSINGSTTRVGIGLSNPQFELEISGEISATNKSFVIDHPTKSGMKLRYGSLEGPENGVYVRGELNNSNIIEVPEHWLGLVHEDSYTVHLTPIGNYAQLYVEKIENYNVFVADNMMCPIHCYYSVWAERKDIPKLVTEY